MYHHLQLGPSRLEYQYGSAHHAPLQCHSHPAPFQLLVQSCLHQPSSSRSKSLRKKKTASIDEIFPDHLPNSTEEDRDAKVVADREDEEQRSQHDMQDQLEAKGEDEAQQDEENCPDPMETLGELEFVYEELELRVEIHRARHQARMAATPKLRKPPLRPFDATFYLSAANQSYTLDILHEFYATLANIIKRDGTTWVFVRKHMYEFSSGIINSIFKTPCQEADFPRMLWTTENLDDAVSTITGGKKNGWGNLSMLDVTPTMNILFKFCVFNWMPTANRSTLTIDRLKFIHMLTEGRPFDFGVMVFDQIYDLRQQAISGKANKLLFPYLIQHVLETQHPIPVRGVDADPVAPRCPSEDFYVSLLRCEDLHGSLLVNA
ncbi:hypothetical protein F2Q68_00004352 [Brassica cretica]|uniref:Putative plant transposon protein domain-containing protein n=1 Tax=Brassica cretica TaxID=69181 RepID=A0A8S9JDE6_BRACR|nr:hypothetical protein F2Q68_00004352 [Brassica cretica]